MKTPEGKVKDEIKAYLSNIGAYHFWPVQTGYGAATVDCLCCYRGQFIGIEVKRLGGKATERQIRTLQKISLAGGKAFVVDALPQVASIIYQINETLEG